jgi:hypothetical protein
LHGDPVVVAFAEIGEQLLSFGGDRGWADDASMTTAVAARYCGLKSTTAIRRAFRDGRLVALGRRDGTGTYMWSRLVPLPTVYQSDALHKR